MPFDPNIPATNAEATSAMFRDQFNGLKTLIDAVPTITGAVLDGVTTGNPGDPAAVNLSLVGTELHFGFTLPRGNAGATGATWAPFGSVVIDSVTTVNPDQPASAGVSFDGTNVHFLFSIPRGAAGINGIDGATGAPGLPGNDGGQGPQGNDGPPGEVTTAALAAAIDGTSNNSNAVATFPDTAPSSYDQVTMQALIDKVDELINALRR